MSHIQYVFRGSIFVRMWDLQTPNFDSGTIHSIDEVGFCNTIFCPVTTIKILLHVRCLQKYPLLSHIFYGLEQCFVPWVIFKFLINSPRGLCSPSHWDSVSFFLRLIGQKSHAAEKAQTGLKYESWIFSIWAEGYIGMATPYTLVYGEFWISYFNATNSSSSLLSYSSGYIWPTESFLFFSK